MKENEDGFIPVEQCVEALLRPAKYPPYRTDSIYNTYLDLRLNVVRQLCPLVHTSHTDIVNINTYKTHRVVGSFEIRRAVSSCEDHYELILALTAAKKLTT